MRESDVTLPARFDGATIWALLPPDLQASIGAAALELIVGETAVVTLREWSEAGVENAPWSRAAEASVEAAGIALGERVIEALDDLATGPAPLIPSLLGPICRVCGCSDNDACQIGCSWVEADLCSACVPAEVAHG